MPATVQLGSVLWLDFPAHMPQGHEQQGRRAGIVVGLPETLTPHQRFKNLIVVPTTSQDGTWRADNPLYPLIPAGSSCFTRDSVVLLDQIRAIDQSRIVGFVGQLNPLQFGLVQSGLKKLLSLK